MKEKLRNKKVVYMIIGIVSVLLVALAVTYAYWLVTKSQAGENQISSACLDIAISGEKNDIELTNQFPMSDEYGMKLVPYQFTVTNNCNTSVEYQVALEAIGTESNSLKASSIKVALNDKVTLLSNNGEVNSTISGAYEARSLAFSKLGSKDTDSASESYELRIWIDENAPVSENNKTFTSKISVSAGQGIEIPYAEDTLAYNILANYGGAAAAREISYELVPQNPDDVGISVDWIFDEEIYWYATSYTYDKTTSKFSLSGTLTQATITECQNGIKNCGKYTLKSTDENASDTIVTELVDISDKYNLQVKRIGIANQFTTGTRANESGLFKAPDDYGTSYYFRGNPTNNYVLMGPVIRYEGCYAAGVEDSCVSDSYYATEAECLENYSMCKERASNYYWRIVRINGDGTIRMIYNDIIGEGNYNNSSYRTHVGYMFGTTADPYTNTNSSAVKNRLDTWYSTNLKSKFEQYIADSIFCNDREISEIKTNETEYMARSRFKKSAPKLTCTQQNDRFTVDDTTLGNGALTYPIGLLTADEYMMAGRGNSSSYNSDIISFLTGVGDGYWTMTPMHTGTSNSSVYDSDLNGPYVTQSGVYPDYRPVINLKADVEFTGTGTVDDPYVIVTE